MADTKGKDPKEGGATVAAKAPKARGKAAGAKVPWTFPKNSLEDALRIPRALEEKNAGRPMNAAQLVRAVGFNLPNDWRFLDLLRSANQYGLVQGSGSSATVEMDKIGEDVVAPSSSAQRQEALVRAFRHVELFKKVEEFYGGKKIPEDEFFENNLVREFAVPRDRVKTFIEVFTSNLRYLNLFTGRKRSTDVVDADGPADAKKEDGVLVKADPADPAARVRQFLDSCFVMMPFGDWFDRYYQEIYVPAIRAAGFEPVRSDELFATGSVVEQIWEQIEKSSVLLADLTDKNANVFYELGLAHAAHKPVVLSAARIEDVPFDLRHLRVITYDVREPRWADNLAKAVTDHLKNAKAEPGKSIPQPFRDMRDEDAAANP
jgi:hypothetical protein